MSISNKLKQIEMITMLNDSIKEIYYKYFISDEKLINKKFNKRLGRNVNLKKPEKFNDKLQWLKLYWHDPIATQCADKYKVREFIKERIGARYLNELFEVYKSVDEIDLSKLPKSFVLKGTHGSGYNIICKDKDNMNWNKEFKKMRRWLRQNYYWRNREWVYKDIKPRIIAESFIEQEDGKELRDYRFFCFNGKPKFIGLDLNINDKAETRRNLYDVDWNLLHGEISYPKELNIVIEKPSKLKKMIKLSEMISEPFPHARVDFYQVKDKILFGEITFFHQSGMGIFYPPEFEKEIGDFLKLPGKNNEN